MAAILDGAGCRRPRAGGQGAEPLPGDQRAPGRDGDHRGPGQGRGGGGAPRRRSAEGRSDPAGGADRRRPGDREAGEGRAAQPRRVAALPAGGHRGDHPAGAAAPALPLPLPAGDLAQPQATGAPGAGHGGADGGRAVRRAGPRGVALPAAAGRGQYAGGGATRRQPGDPSHGPGKPAHHAAGRDHVRAAALLYRQRRGGGFRPVAGRADLHVHPGRGLCGGRGVRGRGADARRRRRHARPDHPGHARRRGGGQRRAIGGPDLRHVQPAGEPVRADHGAATAGAGPPHPAAAPPADVRSAGHLSPQPGGEQSGRARGRAGRRRPAAGASRGVLPRHRQGTQPVAVHRQPGRSDERP